MTSITMNGENQIIETATNKILPFVVLNRQGRREICALDATDDRGRKCAGTVIANVAQVWGTPEREAVIAGHIADFQK